MHTASSCLADTGDLPWVQQHVGVLSTTWYSVPGSHSGRVCFTRGGRRQVLIFTVSSVVARVALDIVCTLPLPGGPLGPLTIHHPMRFLSIHRRPARAAVVRHLVTGHRCDSLLWGRVPLLSAYSLLPR